MRSVDWQLDAVSLTCPNDECASPLPEPATGSRWWTPQDFKSVLEVETATITCTVCGMTSKIPRGLARLVMS